MSLYRQNKERRQRRNLIIVTLIAVLLFGLNFFTHGLLAAPVRSGTAAVWGSASAIIDGMTGSGFLRRASTLAHENAQQKQQIADLQEQLASNQAQIAELDDLRQLAHIAATSPGITAPVVSSYKSSPYGTFLVGAGLTAGVQKNALVLSKEGFVIGRVTDVSSNQSLVTELYAPQSKVDAQAGSIPLSLTGRGGGNAEGEAPRGASIATGTPVVSPLFMGLPVGIVGDTESSPSSASVKVYVRTPVNMETLRFVYIKK